MDGHDIVDLTRYARWRAAGADGWRSANGLHASWEAEVTCLVSLSDDVYTEAHLLVRDDGRGLAQIEIRYADVLTPLIIASPAATVLVRLLRDLLHASTHLPR